MYGMANAARLDRTSRSVLLLNTM